MKKLTISLFAFLLCTSCSTELELISTDLPPAVASNFSAKFPGATEVEWEAEKEDGHLIFKAEFEYDGKEREAKFKPDGSMIEEEKD